ncbi:MAG: ATP-binding cassette domain-containing protein [Betaproteobacteria bacterium]|nr:ATP-binding cassette domain-containing protein [Betaproteobacteria bacterium]
MNDAGEVLLDAVGLTRHFHSARRLFEAPPPAVRAVEKVSLQIRTGETLALVGESGSGKSTLGRLILRLLEPTSGTMRFQGREVLTRDPPDKQFRRNLQVVFQDPRSSLNPRRTIFKIIRDPMLLHGLTTKEEARAVVAGVLERVGLSPAHRYLDRQPGQFSGGQLQRICIARAIALRPRLIVADEPVSALDASVRAQILLLIQSLQREDGLSFLFITHDLAVVRTIAHHVAVMYLGRIVEQGPVGSLFANPLHPYTQALLSATPVPNPRSARQRIVLTGEIPSPAHPPAGCKFHTRCPLAMDKCRQVEPQLERQADGRQVACHLVPGEAGPALAL